MSDVFRIASNSPASERRVHLRQRVLLSCMQLENRNGGIILDISEHGLALQAVRSLVNQSPTMRFQLSQSDAWIETQGRIAWISDSRRTAGVEFVGLPVEARDQIRQWISLTVHPSGSAEESLLGEQIQPVTEVLPARGPESLVSVPEPTRLVAENQGEHPIAEYPAGVPPSSDRGDTEHVAQNCVLNSATLASPENVKVAAGPPFRLSYQGTMFEREIRDDEPTLGGFTGLTFAAVLLVSAFFFLGRQFHRIVNIHLGQKVIAPAKVSVLPADSPLNSTTLSVASDLLDEQGFVLQVGAMNREENADALAESLHQKNFPAFVAWRETDRFYRVVVGPYNDVDSTLRVKEQLQKQGFDVFRTPWNPSAKPNPTPVASSVSAQANHTRRNVLPTHRARALTRVPTELKTEGGLSRSKQLANGDMNHAAGMSMGRPSEQSTDQPESRLRLDAPIPPPTLEGVTLGASETLGTISLISNPPGAEVYVDDSFVGQAPATLSLTPGKHSIRAFASDYKNWSQWITVEGGSQTQMTATLEKQLN
jgi:hypothetical protein